MNSVFLSAYLYGFAVLLMGLLLDFILVQNNRMSISEWCLTFWAVSLFVNLLHLSLPVLLCLHLYI